MNVRFGKIFSPARAYGEQIKCPHKPILDEMGPHDQRGAAHGRPLRLPLGG
jgi:hypothetical protein